MAWDGLDKAEKPYVYYDGKEFMYHSFIDPEDSVADACLTTGAKWVILEQPKPQFTKDSLKTVMLVKLRDGRWFTVLFGVKADGDIQDICLDVESPEYCTIDSITDTLEDDGDMRAWDIVKVATMFHIGDLFSAMRDGDDVEGIDGFKVIWERQ